MSGFAFATTRFITGRDTSAAARSKTQPWWAVEYSRLKPETVLPVCETTA